MEEEDADPRQPPVTEIPPNGSGAQTRAVGTATTTAAAGTTVRGVNIPPVVTHLRFGTS
jgi:hypothetical protein